MRAWSDNSVKISARFIQPFRRSLRRRKKKKKKKQESGKKLITAGPALRAGQGV
ncbi:MAG: hypothetical protein GY795_42620 [Desulfobacterales bacterium]|nr:hypothetical protein [Desulfobacterales bacterium]